MSKLEQKNIPTLLSVPSVYSIGFFNKITVGFVLTRGAAARNEPSPGTEAFPHSLDSPEGTLMVETTRNQKPAAIRSFVRQTLGFNYN